MNVAVPLMLLTEGNTVEMSRVGHRLALGVQWRDAVSQFPVTVPAPADMVTSRSGGPAALPHAA